MRLWDFAAEAYGRPGVEAACLALQDDHGQCVPLLLWRLWMLEEGRPADAALLRSAAEAAGAWEDVATTPLRRLRRQLKRSFPPIAAARREALREEVKRAELEAERALLEALEAMSPAPASARMAAVDALAATAEAWGKPAPTSALARLAGAFA